MLYLYDNGEPLYSGNLIIKEEESITFPVRGRRKRFVVFSAPDPSIKVGRGEIDCTGKKAEKSLTN